MNEFALISNRREIEHFQLQDTKAVLERGFKYYVGEFYKWLPEYDKVASWLSDNEKRGLLMFGNNGRGKTILSMKILPVIFKYYLKKDYYYVDAMNLGEYLRNDIESYNILISTKPIIIDDIGVESMTDFYGDKRDVVSEIIDMCEKRGRLFIATTNLTPDEIGERYGLRTLDRLKSITRSIKFYGESLRGTHD